MLKISNFEVVETILQMNVEKLKARYPHGFDAGHSQHRSSGDI